MGKPFLSIVIPVYNKEPHVSRSIMSVLNQSFKNYELIIVCDPSSDGSNSEVEKIKDKRIRVFYRKEPGAGGYAARNLGIENSQAKWIAFLDADDEWLPNHLSKMIYLSERFPFANILSCSWATLDSNGIELDRFYCENYISSKIIDLHNFLSNELKSACPICTSVAFMKKDLLKDIEGFPAGKITMGGDMDTWLRAMAKEGKMAWSNHVGALYFRDSINMVTKSSIVEPRLHELTTRKIISNEKLDDKLKKLLNKRVNRYVLFAWNQNVKLNQSRNFKLLGRLAFRVEPIKVSFYYLLSLLPGFVLVVLHRFLRTLIKKGKLDRKISLDR